MLNGTCRFCFGRKANRGLICLLLLHRTTFCAFWLFVRVQFCSVRSSSAVKAHLWAIWNTSNMVGSARHRSLPFPAQGEWPLLNEALKTTLYTIQLNSIGSSSLGGAFNANQHSQPPHPLLCWVSRGSTYLYLFEPRHCGPAWEPENQRNPVCIATLHLLETHLKGADICNDLKVEQAHHSKRHQETSDSRSRQVEALMTMDALGCNAETHALGIFHMLI